MRDPAAKNLNILVAEDNSTNQILVRRLPEKRGHKVEFAGDGFEAVSKAQKGKFDIIFMDCEMPNMDGYEATRHIRNLESSKNTTRVPIIALTAHALQGDKDVCMQAGMDGYLTKPIDRIRFDELLSEYENE